MADNSENAEEKIKTEENRDLGKFFIDNQEEVSKYIRVISNEILRHNAQQNKYLERLTRAQSKTATAIICGVLFLITVGLLLTWFLVAEQLLSGETFVFFIGAMVGSLITFLGERVTPLLYAIEGEE